MKLMNVMVALSLSFSGSAIAKENKSLFGAVFSRMGHLQKINKCIVLTEEIEDRRVYTEAYQDLLDLRVEESVTRLLSDSGPITDDVKKRVLDFAVKSSISITKEYKKHVTTESSYLNVDEVQLVLEYHWQKLRCDDVAFLLK